MFHLDPHTVKEIGNALLLVLSLEAWERCHVLAF